MHHRSWSSLAGTEGEDDPLLTEFLDTCRELAPFARLLGGMNPVTDCPVASDESKRHFCRAFEVDGIAGLVIVVHNADVGTSPAPDAIAIDGNGSLKGFEGFRTPAPVRLRQTGAPRKLFRCDTGRELVPDAGTHEIEITPGGGAVLFAGDEAEFRRLRETFLPHTGKKTTGGQLEKNRRR